MSKLSKRAITLFVIATMVLSILSAFIAVPVMAAPLTLVSATPATLASGESTTYTIAFTTATEIPKAGWMEIVFPVGYTLDAAGVVTTTATYAGTFTSGIDVALRTVTIDLDGVNPLAALTAVSVEITLVTNPAVIGDYIINVATSVPDTGSDTVTIFQATESLTISTSPVGGVVYVDGDYWGAAPQTQVVDVGTYTVSFGTMSGYTTPDPQIATVEYGTPETIMGTYVLTAPDPGFSIDSVSATIVDYAKVLTVTGSGVTAGSEVIVYWNYAYGTYVHPLNNTEGNPDATFDLEITVPSDVIGAHYLWARDVATGATDDFGPITMVPKIKLSPSSGLENDEVTIKGYGFSEDVEVPIAFPGPIALSGDTGVGDTDDLGYFEYIFKVAEGVTDDTYDVTADDPVAPITSAQFIVGAAITLDKTVGPAGTIVKVDGRGFIEYTPGLIATLDSVPVYTKDGEGIDASSTGTFTVYVVIPSVEIGNYELEITDGETPAKVAKADFEVDGETSITVTPEYGTPGTVITVKGYNFTRISGTKVELVLGVREAEATTDSSGSFTGTIVIPPSDLGEKYPVIATDTVGLCSAQDEVLVTIIFLQLSDYSAPVGSAVTLMGSGFTAGGAPDYGEWNATFGDLDLIKTTDIDPGRTYFSETFHVPSVPSGTYTIGVYDVVREITVGIDFTVTDQAALSVSRAAIPNGYNLTIKGVNFAEYIIDPAFETTWWIFNSTDAWNLNDQTNVTYGGVVPITSTEEDEEGTFTGYYKIPKFLELGTYTINCTTVSNDYVDPAITQYAEVDIEIVPEEIVIHIGSPSYARGQTITFVIKTTLKKEPFHLGIKDPEGSEFFNSTWNEEADDDSWKILGSWFYIPSNLQVDKNTDWLYTLPVDATPGTWTYSFWDDAKEYANGTFQVTELTELEQLRNDIGELSEDMEGIGTSVVDLATTVAGVSGAAAEAAAAAATAATAAAEAQAAAEAGIAAIDDLSEISQDALDAANNAMSAADAAKDAADSGLAAANAAQTTAQQAADAADKAADAAEGAKSAASGLTTLVYGAIGASLIAALAAIVSLMQISRRIAG